MRHGFPALGLALILAAGSAALADDEPAPATTAAPATPAADGMEGNVQFLLGQSYLGDGWKPLDRPAVFGVEVDFAPKSSPVHVALATSISGDGGSVVNPYFGKTGNIAVGFIEFSAGFVWLPVKKAIVRPYLGAGVLTLFAGVDSGSNAWNGGDADHSFGFYGNAGLYFKVGSSFNIGFDGRIVRGTSVTLAGTELDANYERASMLFGFSWGE
jgi:hypothetical protein